MMSSASLTYVVPGWWPAAAVLFGIVALVCGWLFIRRPHPHLSPRLRAGLWALRVAGGLLLLACALDWRQESARQEVEKPMLQVIVDNSASMTTADASGGRTRFEEAKSRLRDEILPGYDSRRIGTACAGDGFSSVDPLMATPDAKRSDLGKALRDALEDGGDRTRGAVILISDGAAADPEDLRAAARLYRTARVPVYPWVTGTDRQPADVRIASVSLRQPSASQATIHLNATVESPGHGGEDTELTVKFGDQILHRQTLRLDGGRQEVTADFLSPYLGCQFYDIAVEPVKGETSLANNRARAACDLHRDPIRVLYMEGSVPAETDYLKDGLEADPEMSVTSLHFPGEGSLEDLAAQALQVRGKDPRIFYDAHGREVPSVCHATRGYPASLAELLKYDVVIDSDIIKEAFTPQQMADTVAFVEQYGGGFVMVGGQTSFGAGGYETTVIDKLMPVEIANRSDPLWYPFQVKVTEAGYGHPMMKVGSNPTETQSAWTARFPGFNGANYARRAKPGAHVLARMDSPGTGMDGLVLFAVQNIGRGRTMAFMSDTTSGWGDRFETQWGESRSDSTYYRKFWNNTIRWLAADRIARKGGQALIETSTVAVTPGDVVPVRVVALTATELAGLEVSIREGDAAAQPVSLQWNGANRSWEGSFVPKAAGDVVIEAAYRNAEGAPVVTRSGVRVRLDSDESVAVAARSDLLGELARETGGELVDEQNVKRILSELATKAVPVTWKRSIPVWDRWWILLPLLALVIFEWLLRRKLEPVGRQ
jgi:uncharacterized membrane protein